MVIYKPLKSTSTIAHILPDMAFTTSKHLYLKLRVTKEVKRDIRGAIKVKLNLLVYVP
jgi:hypothetical protein